MNVAIFTDNDFNKVNGVTTTLRAVLEHAPPHIRPRIYTCEGARVEQPDYLALKAPGVGIPFYREMKVYLPPLRDFLGHVGADRIDLIHLTTPGPVGLAAAWVASRARLPMIGSFHTDLAQYARLLSGWPSLGAAMREYMRWPYGRCQRVLVPSEATRDTVLRGKIAADKVALWRRGVSSERFTPEKRSNALRARWGVSDDRPAILYVGRLSREKNLAAFGAMAAALARAAVGHRLVFVGDGPLRAELQRLCPDALFMGTLPHDEVATAMASADLFVFPSLTDTAGNVVLEAQASGLPVLVSEVGGPRENMIAGETGEVCAGVDEFVRRTIDLLRDGNRRCSQGACARQYARGRGWHLSLHPLYEAYSEAIARAKMPAREDVPQTGPGGGRRYRAGRQTTTEDTRGTLTSSRDSAVNPAS